MNTAKFYKITGETFISIPVLLLLIFAVGEVAGGILSGLQHLFQLLPLLLFTILCWYKPKLGGVLLIVVASLLFIAYFVSMPHVPVFIRLINDFLLFGFPIIGGITFLIGSLREKAASLT